MFIGAAVYKGKPPRLVKGSYNDCSKILNLFPYNYIPRVLDAKVNSAVELSRLLSILRVLAS